MIFFMLSLYASCGEAASNLLPGFYCQSGGLLTLRAAAQAVLSLVPLQVVSPAEPPAASAFVRLRIGARGRVYGDTVSLQVPPRPKVSVAVIADFPPRRTRSLCMRPVLFVSIFADCWDLRRLTFATREECFLAAYVVLAGRGSLPAMPGGASGLAGCSA
jgi:hypothetical protein